MCTKLVIVDCDNTFGVPGRPVDDGQTLLYLMGRSDIRILGITTTFGNGNADTVYDATCWLVAHSVQPEIPVYKGSCQDQNKPSEASKFLSKSAATYPGKVQILAIGSMRNLYQAQSDDHSFFSNLAGISIMGGYRYPLPYKGWNKIPEVNFSHDPEATLSVLSASCPVTIFDAHICFQAPFGLKELHRLYPIDRSQFHIIQDYLLSNIDSLYEPVDYLWDLLPAVYLSYPELFHSNHVHLASTVEDFKTGTLKISNTVGPEINVPDHITDIDLFYNVLYEAWEKAPLVMNRDAGTGLAKERV